LAADEGFGIRSSGVEAAIRARVLLRAGRGLPAVGRSFAF
jgi:hypothetical protein